MANKTVVIEQVNPLLYIEPQERCPSPVYAEVHKDKKKKQQQDHSVVIDEREGNQSPEYSQVQSFNKHSKDIVYQENQEDEQHYYHSLENPAEHGNNKIVFINKHSQEPQIVSTLSMLCKTPGPADPDATNTHTEINDSESEFNTFPNPCYDHTQRQTDD